MQPNKCHYLHKYLHGNLICHISTTNEQHWARVAAYFKAGGRKSKQVVFCVFNDPTYALNKVSTNTKTQVRNHVEAMREYMHDVPFQDDVEDGVDGLHTLTEDRRSTWSRPLVSAFSRLVGAVRFRQGGAKNATGNMLLVLDEHIMEYTSEWCNACNMEATNHLKIKRRLFGEDATEEDRGVFRPLLNVPLSSDLPLGMRLMHDTYLFIYTMCTCIAVFISNLTTNATKQAKVRERDLIYQDFWRIQASNLV